MLGRNLAGPWYGDYPRRCVQPPLAEVLGIPDRAADLHPAAGADQVQARPMTALAEPAVMLPSWA
jgi:hypothetical protein